MQSKFILSNPSSFLPDKTMACFIPAVSHFLTHIAVAFIEVAGCYWNSHNNTEQIASAEVYMVPRSGLKLVDSKKTNHWYFQQDRPSGLL